MNMDLDYPSNLSNEYDAVIVAVPHEPYLILMKIILLSITKPHGTDRRS